MKFLSLFTPVLFLGGVVFAGVSPGDGSAPSGYFCYTEIFTQRDYRDSAFDPDPMLMDVEATITAAVGALPTGTGEEVKAASEFQMRMWDQKLLQMYVTVLSDMDQRRALDLKKEQIGWSKVRSNRVQEIRDSKNASWYDVTKAYTDSTRWRIAVLEERFRYPDGKWMEYTPGKEGSLVSPAQLMPEELLVEWDGENARKVVEKGGGGFSLTKDLWDAELLLAYVKLLRILPKDRALELAIEEEEWEKERFHLWEEFNSSDGSEAESRKWAEGYAKMTRERIAKLKEDGVAKSRTQD